MIGRRREMFSVDVIPADATCAGADRVGHGAFPFEPQADPACIGPGRAECGAFPVKVQVDAGCAGTLLDWQFEASLQRFPQNVPFGEAVYHTHLHEAHSSIPI